MLDKTYFQIFYGQGEIRYGQFGVDVTGFPSVTKGIDRQSERSFRSLYNWLMKCLMLNHDQWELTISAVSTRMDSPEYWELVPILSTRVWKAFIESTTQRGLPLIMFVQAEEKVNAETENPHRSDETTIHEEVVENNENNVNEVGVDINEEGETSETV